MMKVKTVKKRVLSGCMEIEFCGIRYSEHRSHSVICMRTVWGKNNKVKVVIFFR